MCILCVVQKWSRRVATMLPWLVIPLIGLWALSQLLPPGFRFEVTSPRVACVLVLLVTLFWYEILMPQLSAWRARRSARLRERKMFEAIEMQKLRKMATRRCRNCLNPYRDQNPGGGRFMCSYCGHVSKRPVLDIPGSTGLGTTNSGIIGDLVGRGGKIWNGKVWSENGWVCRHDWLENGNFPSESFTGKSNFWVKNGGGFCSGDDHCLAEKSYSGFVFTCRLLASFFLTIRWLWRKIFRVTSSEDALSGAEHRRMLSNKGENGQSFHESKGEKARRKAEEKRQARLERELLEEEERKQREEVAKLVEERRKLRDVKMEMEKEQVKGSVPDREKYSKREAERKRQERRKEKDKGSSKSNSDCEEVERRAGKESEKKQEFDKKMEIERRGLQNTVTENGHVRSHSYENGNVVKITTANNFSRGSGSKYLDHVKGSFISSSRAFNGAGFFGNGAHTSGNFVSRSSKPIGYIDNIQASGNRRDVHSTDHMPGKPNSNGDDKASETGFYRPVVPEMQQRAAPKKSWQQLFTRSPAVPTFSVANVISRPNQKPQPEAESFYLHGPASPAHPLNDQIRPELPLPFIQSPFPNVSTSSLISSAASESMFPLVGEPQLDFISEESENFEDPCYIPDPVTLLGPVSEALDNFPLDLGTGFVNDTELERPQVQKNVLASAEVNKLSPIESPLSRLRVAEERHANSNPFPSTPKNQSVNASLLSESSNVQAQGMWQMWGTPSLGHDGLGLVGGPASWPLPLGKNKSNQEDVHPSFRKAMMAPFAKENQVLPGTLSPDNVHIANCQNGGMFRSLVPGSNDNDPWSQKSVLQPLLGEGGSHFPPQNEVTFGRSATDNPFELSPAFSKKDWAVHGSGEVGNLTPARPHIGGLFSTPDVQSLWSFNN